MNEIVLIALRRPLTFVVLAILILLFGARAIKTTPTDIFPDIGVPVVAAVWQYTGLAPSDMSGRIVSYYERALTTVVNNIEHVESNSLYGIGIVKTFFQPGTDINAAQAQIAALSQTVLKTMPPGITPPLILVYSASSVPVLNLRISSRPVSNGKPLPLQALQDLAQNFIRPMLVKVKGASIPYPYGGAQRQIQIDLNQEEMLAHNISAAQISAALSTQNVVTPAGDMKVGHIDYYVATNAAPVEVDTFNNLPIKRIGNAVVYMRDVAYVHVGNSPQANVVMVNGQQAILLPVLKTGNASTLDVVAGVRAMLPQIQATMPDGVQIDPISDASVFVRESVIDVVREMGIAAVLTGLMVLVFLGSWRSTLIIATSIPLSILCSIMVLSWLGETINVMTLGGLALAVGILVDDATVMIENITAHREMGKELHEAIVDAANQIVVPTFVSTLCICIVFLPLLTLSGISGYLFLPLAEAIVFAMLASFILSRTLVPTMAAFLLKSEKLHHEGEVSEEDLHSRNPFRRAGALFEKGFHALREAYIDFLSYVLELRWVFIGVFMGIILLSFGLAPSLGWDFFPDVNGAEIDLHMRAPLGLRIEDTSALSLKVEQAIKEILPGKVRAVSENIGLPISGINNTYLSTGTVGTSDADLSISLVSGEAPTEPLEAVLRRELPKRFPGIMFSFLPGSITSKILNFGLPAPIDVQVIGQDIEGNMAFAQKVLNALQQVPGIADAHVQQSLTSPTFEVDASRSFALQTNLTESDIASNALITLSGSGQTQPNYFLNQKNGVSYLIDLQTPQWNMNTMGGLETVPVSGAGVQGTQLLGALGKVKRVGTPSVFSHYDIAPSIDIYASNQVRDLGGVYDDIETIVNKMKKDLPKGSRIELRGQATTMFSAYEQLVAGLALSILLIYLIIVVNFQSWLDPFVIITALPAAMAGIVWSLFLTGTNLSVPALTGAIMCMGTATANSILVVSFARERLAEHGDSIRAALEAGHARIRPVLMTAMAMIIGMLPMSFSNTENAPLGRAVVGGLLFATISTLLFVPSVFAIVRAGSGKISLNEYSEDPADQRGHDGHDGHDGQHPAPQGGAA